MVVEDDKDLNKTVCSFLNYNGYDAIGCLNVFDAYDALEENVFDLIVSDMMTNVLKLNKLEKQQIFPKTEEYDLGEQLCDCLLNYENVWENKDRNVSFSYVYSAEEQDEICKIRKKYEFREEDPISRIRKLDNSVTQKATAISLVFGIIGVLIMGSGMSFIMTDLGSSIGMSGSIPWILGMLTGVIGIILVVLAYPMYNNVLKKEREKVASEILELTEELMR